MIKRIKFPLKMENNREVRTINELKENFSLNRVLEYYLNKRLYIWLRDRNLDDLVDELVLVENEDIITISKKICEVFDVEYTEEISVEEKEIIEERTSRIEKLKSYVDHENYKEVIDSIAFLQQELDSLLTQNRKEIYLCGETFTIPLNHFGVRYIGINQPIVVVQSREVIDWSKREIQLEGIKYDEDYQKIVAKKLEQESRKKYCKSYLASVMSHETQKKAEHLYDKISSQVLDIQFDVNKESKRLRQIIESSHLCDIALRYLEH